MFKPQIALLITDYQYLFCRGSGHGVGDAQAQFLPHALEWVWKGYAPNPDK
jgi:iron(III)-enterobactin esterase